MPPTVSPFTVWSPDCDSDLDVPSHPVEPMASNGSQVVALGGNLIQRSSETSNRPRSRQVSVSKSSAFVHCGVLGLGQPRIARGTRIESLAKPDFVKPTGTQPARQPRTQGLASAKRPQVAVVTRTAIDWIDWTVRHVELVAVGLQVYAEPDLAPGYWDGCENLPVPQGPFS